MENVMKKPLIDYLYKNREKGFISLRQIQVDLNCPMTFLNDVIEKNRTLFEMPTNPAGFGDDKYSSVRLNRNAIEMYEKKLL